MFTIHIWVTLSLDVVALSLLSTQLVLPLLSPCNSNSRCRSHHALLANLSGNLPTAKSMLSCWLMTIATSPSRTHAYKLRLHPLNLMRLQAFQSDTTFIALTPMHWLLLGLRLYLSAGYARFSMPAPTRTSFNTTLALNFIMRIIVMSELPHPTNLSDASGSLTKSPIAYHTLLTSMHWMPQCLPIPWRGSLRKFIHIFCTLVIQTVKSFFQTNSPPQLPLFRHPSTARLEFAFHHGNAGFKHTLMMQRWAPSTTLCSILPKLICLHLMRLTSIIAPLYGNLKL
jgi:hypothetical protein